MDDKICSHNTKGRVVAKSPTGSLAVTDTCQRRGCVAASVAWANRVTQTRSAEFVPAGVR